jgi:signal transduction histidine kinase
MARLAVQSKAQKFLHVERARIARDIHDDLGAQLTELVLLAEVARTELAGNSEAQAQIDQLCARARDLSHAMDEVVWAVNSRRDTLRDFASYVCKYAQLFLASTSIRCRLDVDSDIPATAFDLPVRRNLFIAVKEALNNAAKHSGANELFLRIRRSQRHFSVIVEDNGKGFDLENLNWERNGMTNMNQRMAEVSGEFRIASRPGAGCRLEFIVPLPSTSRLSKWFRARFNRSTAENSGVAHGKGVTGIGDTKPASR